MDNTRLDDKLDQVLEKVNEIEKTLLRNTISLETHEKRTTLAEHRLTHIETHVTFVNNLVKVGIGLSGIAGTVLIVLQIVEKLKI